MKIHNTTPIDSLNLESKDKYFKNQKDTIFLHLQDHVATASMIAAETGISQKNICRYKRDLERDGLLKEVKKAVCKQTGFKAWYLTTNPSVVPHSDQTSTNTNNEK